MFTGETTLSDTLFVTAGVLTAAVLTPGPNNFVVMDATVRGGFRNALPAIAGIVLGGIALLGCVMIGAGSVFSAEPQLRIFLAVSGSVFLAGMGVALVAKSFAPIVPQETEAIVKAPGAIALFVFQFLNPKSWITILTVVSVAASGTGGLMQSFLGLCALFLVIPTTCLFIWSSFGRVLAGYLRRRSARAWFDRAMGLLLTASAVSLLGHLQ